MNKIMMLIPSHSTKRFTPLRCARIGLLLVAAALVLNEYGPTAQNLTNSNVIVSKLIRNESILSHNSSGSSSSSTSRCIVNDSKPSSHGGGTSSKHVIILHAGPHKTSSTTVQQILLAQSSRLRADGYETLDDNAQAFHFSGCPSPFNMHSIKNHATLAFALQGRCPNNDTSTPPVALLQLSDFLSVAFARNRSVILSTEEFAQPFTNLTILHEQLQQVSANFAGGGGGVEYIVILYYRRLLEWLPSIYYEIHKRFFTTNNNDDVSQQQPIPSFAEWLTIPSTLDDYLLLYTWAVKERFEIAGFDHVKILPMHRISNSNKDTNGTTTNSSSTTTLRPDTSIEFICDYVPRAHQTCHALLQEQQDNNNQQLPFRFNQGNSLEYHRILELAIQAGLVNMSKTTPQQAILVQRLQQKLSSLPRQESKKYMTCLTNQVRARLLELALDFEDKMATCSGAGGCSAHDTYNHECIIKEKENNSTTFSTTTTQQQQQIETKEQLRAEFSDQLLESEKLCSWNAQLLLQEDEWKSFFQSLGD